MDSRQNPDEDEIAKYVEKSLRVHVEVVRQSYCRVDDGALSASLDVTLRFTNSSERPVILSRKIESPNIVRVARDADAANKGEFLYAPDVMFAMAELPPDAPPFGPAPDPKLFILLAPRQSFETEVKTGVLGVTKAKGNGLLAKGSYVLQVGVSTWPYEWPNFSSKTDAQELKQRWNQYGNLATGLVYSDLAPFTLPERFKNRRCS
jgi:hypothetical protein